MVELCQNILYHMMFGIDDIDHLKTYSTILDCPSGTSSFFAESNNNYGINTVGCDPLFDLGSSILQKKGEEDIEYVVNRVLLSPDLYNWNFYLSIEQLREYRKLALDQFISDCSIVRKRKRYLNESGVWLGVDICDNAPIQILCTHLS
jgi:hypothetical protein